MEGERGNMDVNGYVQGLVGGWKPSYSSDELDAMDNMGLLAVVKNYHGDVDAKTMGKAKVALWQKNISLVDKVFFSHRDLYRNIPSMTLEDFRQDVWFAYELALNSFNFSSAYKAGVRSWTTWFYRYVMNAMRHDAIALGHLGVPARLDAGVEDKSYDAVELEQYKSHTSDDVKVLIDNMDAKSVVDGFISTIVDPKQKSIFLDIMCGLPQNDIKERNGIDKESLITCKRHFMNDLKKYAKKHWRLLDGDFDVWG